MRTSVVDENSEQLPSVKDKPLQQKHSTQNKLDYESLSFSQRQNEMRSLLRDLQIIMVTHSLFKFLVCEAYLEQDIIKDFTKMAFVALMHFLKVYDFKTPRKLNIFFLLIINFFTIHTFEYSTQQIQQRGQFYLYEGILPIIAFQVYILQLTKIKPLYCILNFTVCWLYYFMRVQQVVGIKQVPSTMYTLVLFTIVFCFKSVLFKIKLENELCDVFNALQESQRNLKNILNILPEGILIFDKELKKLEFANLAAYQLIIDNDENIGKYQSNQGSQKLESSFSSVNKKKDFSKEDLYSRIKTTTLRGIKYLQQDKLSTMSLLELITFLPATQDNFAQAKFPSPNKIVADFHSLWIKSHQQKLVIIKDNTALRLREKAILSQELQTVFFSQIAHDLRTPLNSILASNTSLVYQCDQNHPYRPALDLQKNSIQYLIHLIEDIMDLSRLEFKKFSLNEQWFSMEETVNEVFQIIDFQAKLQNVELIQELNIDPFLEIYSDKKRLQQVILNLISNAIKFTKNGSITVRGTVRENTQEQQSHKYKVINNTNSNLFESDFRGGKKKNFNSQQSNSQPNFHSLTIEVRDTGIGMNEEDQKQLFQMFGKLKSSSHLNQKGVGLGLTICKKICEFMGGNISVQSVENQGTIFTFTVQIKDTKIKSPYIQNEETDLTDEMIYQSIAKETNLYQILKHQVQFDLSFSHQPVTANFLCNCSSILIVDDNNFNILALSMVLNEVFKKFNLPIETNDEADDGKAGVEQIIKKSNECCGKAYKLVFVDLNMPKMDGIQMMQTINQMMARDGKLDDYKDSAFVLFTAVSESELQHSNYKDVGFKYFIQKPIDIPKIEEIIRNEFWN